MIVNCVKSSLLALLCFVFVMGAASPAAAQPPCPNCPSIPATPVVIPSPGFTQNPDTAMAASGVGYFSVSLSGQLPQGDPLSTAVSYAGWCGDYEDVPVNATNFGNGILSIPYSTYAAMPQLIQNPPPLGNLSWPKVNWILNNRTGATVVDVQEAIWLVLGVTDPALKPTANAQALAAEYLLGGYVPGQVEKILIALGLNIAKASSIACLNFFSPPKITCSSTKEEQGVLVPP